MKLVLMILECLTMIVPTLQVLLGILMEILFLVIVINIKVVYSINLILVLMNILS